MFFSLNFEFAHLGELQMIEQGSDGALMLGAAGEKYVGHYSFYASFSTDEEYRLEHHGKLLGTLPIDQVLSVGQRLLFAGRTWEIELVDTEKRVIALRAASGGAPPLFLGSTRTLHTRVRQRMRALLSADETPRYLDPAAQRFLREGQAAFKRLSLDTQTLLVADDGIHGCTWLGHAANEALAARLTMDGVEAGLGPLGFRVNGATITPQALQTKLVEYANTPMPSAETLLAHAENLEREKWEFALPPSFKAQNHASMHLDIEEARRWLTHAASSGELLHEQS